MKLKILVITLAVIVGLPVVALGSSLAVSLIQGKTANEAAQILAEQIDSLFGRVENLEVQQAKTNENVTAAQFEIEKLKSENAGLQEKSSRQNRCAELSAQITAKTNTIKAPYLERLGPLQKEYGNLKAVVTGAQPISPDQDVYELMNEMDAKSKEIDVIYLEMEQVLKNDPGLKALLEEANELLCA